MSDTTTLPVTVNTQGAALPVRHGTGTHSFSAPDFKAVGFCAPSYAHGDSRLPLLGQTIGENLRATAERFPGREALVVRSQGYRATYRQLWDATTACARGLLALASGPATASGSGRPTAASGSSCNTPPPARALTGLGELRGTGVDADDVPLGTDQFGKQGGHHAHAAAEVGDMHPPPQAGFEEHAAAARSVESVQNAQAVGGRFAGGEHIRPRGAGKRNPSRMAGAMPHGRPGLRLHQGVRLE